MNTLEWRDNMELGMWDYLSHCSLETYIHSLRYNFDNTLVVSMSLLMYDLVLRMFMLINSIRKLVMITLT